MSELAAGMSLAIGWPRSVTRTSSPALTDLRYSLREAFSFDTVVLFPLKGRVKTNLGARLPGFDWISYSLPTLGEWKSQAGSFAIRDAHGIERIGFRVRAKVALSQFLAMLDPSVFVG